MGRNANAATVSRVREVACDARPDLQPYLNCGAINAEIQQALADELDVDCHVVDGYVRDGPEYDEHAYVSVDAGQLPEASGEVIVDGSVRQFCEENREEGRTWVSLGVRDELPDVAVIDDTDGLHEYYVEWCPF